jgi:hypothetical protein
MSQDRKDSPRPPFGPSFQLKGGQIPQENGGSPLGWREERVLFRFDRHLTHRREINSTDLPRSPLDLTLPCLADL